MLWQALVLNVNSANTVREVEMELVSTKTEAF